MNTKATLIRSFAIIFALVLGVCIPISNARADSTDTERLIVTFTPHKLTQIVSELTAEREISGPIRKRRSQAMEKLSEDAGLAVDGSLYLGPNMVVGSTEELDRQNLANIKSVARIERDEPVAINATPNDSYFSSYLWGLQNSNGAGLNCSSAWDRTTGSSSVVVGVVDTGVDYTHQDLSDNMWINSGEIAGNSIDDDGDGYIDDVYGRDFVNNDNDPMDDHYHGTHVAGTIGAKGNNSLGVVGVNWTSKIMALKVLASNGSGYTSGIIAAIQFAVAQKNRGVNIRVVNMSLGGGSYSSSFYDAITDAGNAGILVVAAAGNSANNNDSTPSYPASYSNDNIISVAALASDGSLASFSNYGATTVDVGAPGVDILNTYPGNQYAWLSGTSMATPHVAGLAALLLSQDSTLSLSALKNLILNSGNQLSSLSGKTVSGRAVNAALAFSSLSTPADPTPTPTPTPTDPTPTPIPIATDPISTPTSTLTPTPTPVQSFTLSGTVKHRKVTLSHVKVKCGSLGSKLTGAKGKFKFTDVLNGTTCDLKATLKGFSFKSINVTITTNTVQNISASLARASSRGRR